MGEYGACQGWANQLEQAEERIEQLEAAIQAHLDNPHYWQGKRSLEAALSTDPTPQTHRVEQLEGELRRLREVAQHLADEVGSFICDSNASKEREREHLEAMYEAAEKVYAALADPTIREQSSGQWCELHGCHQDDPKHAYEYPLCERHLRDATPEEEATIRERTD